jgi:kynurenine formamidase
MPVWSGHAPFQLVTYRTPRGVHAAGDHDGWLHPNEVGFGWHSELMSGGAHTGTHIDALAHVTCGDDDHWFGGSNAAEHSGDHGPTRGDASELPPLITRGVLLDVARFRGLEALPAHAAVGAAELSAVIDAQGVEVRRGDTVLIRTGYGSVFPEPERMAQHREAGIDLSAADLLVELGVVAVGADTEALENLPSTTPGNPHPVHLRLLGDHGIYILELLALEELARDRAYEFLFICLPLAIRGATASMVSPVAIV